MFLQGIINGLSAGSLIAIISIGYSIIARSGITYHFAHAAIFMVGAYVFQILSTKLTNSLILCIAAAGLASALIGLIIERLVYRPLRLQNASQLIVLLSSFGLNVILQNTVSLGFGDASRTVNIFPIQEGWSFLGGRITDLQVVFMGCLVIILILAFLWTSKSRTGKASLAIGNNPLLAKIVGINVSVTLSWVMGIGSLIAGLAGVLSACDIGVFPTMGLMPFFSALVGVIIGRGSLFVTVLACISISLLQQFSILWINAAWQDTIVFIVLILTLLFYPKGLFGQQSQKAAV